VGGILCGTQANLAHGAVRRMLHRWGGAAGTPDTPEGRRRAIAHMKSFGRFHAPSGELAWFLIGSHNVSVGAWGVRAPYGATMHIKSFELSVLLLPSLVPGCTRMVTTAARGGTPAGLAGGVLALRVPYALPPAPYVVAAPAAAAGGGAAGDMPWCVENAPEEVRRRFMGEQD
jgi:hypothetical protein